MKPKSEIIFQILMIFGIILNGLAAAQDLNLSNQTQTYGAYPGGPISSVPSEQMAYAYPGGPVSSVPSEQMAYAYPGVPTSTTIPGQPAYAYPDWPPTTGSSEQIAYAYPGEPTSTTIPGQLGYAYPGWPPTTGPVEPNANAYPVGLGPAMEASTATAIYSTNPPPASQQNILLSYDTQAAPPEAVYYGGTYVPWTKFYQTFPASFPMLWVATSGGWSWYATCPLGSWIQNLMYVPAIGPMKLYELYPDGRTRLYSYDWTEPGYKYIWFYADTPGRHITLFTIYDYPSNYNTIDVI